MTRLILPSQLERGMAVSRLENNLFLSLLSHTQWLKFNNNNKKTWYTKWKDKQPTGKKNRLRCHPDVGSFDKKMLNKHNYCVKVSGGKDIECAIEDV